MEQRRARRPPPFLWLGQFAVEALGVLAAAQVGDVAQQCGGSAAMPKRTGDALQSGDAL
jgi:hypothetical protein